jgi:hypothetical protein
MKEEVLMVRRSWREREWLFIHPDRMSAVSAASRICEWGGEHYVESCEWWSVESEFIFKFEFDTRRIAR